MESEFREKTNQITGDDPELVKAAAEVAEECGRLTDPDPCEAAIKIGDCLTTTGAKKIFKFL